MEQTVERKLTTEQQKLVRLCAKGNRELLKLQREILKR